MFKCKSCDSTEFRLMLQPSFDGQVDISTNTHQEVVVTVNGKEFIADLMFMNHFAVCAHCDGIKTWDYYTPKSSEAHAESA